MPLSNIHGRCINIKTFLLAGAVALASGCQSEPKQEPPPRPPMCIAGCANNVLTYCDASGAAQTEDCSAVVDSAGQPATCQYFKDDDDYFCVGDFSGGCGDETIEGQEARVTTTLKLQTKGKSTKATIDYRLVSHDGRWMVYDVITDELSLVRNYRSQFTRIIGTSGYDGLLNKMKTKLTEERDRDAKEEKERLAKKPAAPAAPAK